MISEKGEQLGILPLEEALENAQEAGLDLIEISPDADPPVCKLLDYGKVKYEKGICPVAEYLHEKELIDEKEYDQKKKELLDTYL